MNDFLFHKLSEEEKEKIKVEAKAILDDFSKELESVKLKDESEIVRDVSQRGEDEEIDCEIDRDIMFNNAPEKNKDFIIAEKKGW